MWHGRIRLFALGISFSVACGGAGLDRASGPPEEVQRGPTEEAALDDATPEDPALEADPQLDIEERIAALGDAGPGSGHETAGDQGSTPAGVVTSALSSGGASSAPNGSLGSIKVLAKVTCGEAYLSFQPGGGGGRVLRGSQGDIPLRKGYPVLVQTAPGLIDGSRWVDPYLLGLSGHDIKQRYGISAELARRIRTRGVNFRRMVAKQVGQGENSARRGWVTGCLEPYFPADARRWPRTRNLTPEGHSEPCCKRREVLSVKTTCAIKPRDRDEYGVFNGHVYLAYNTKLPKGYVFGYASSGQPFTVYDSTTKAGKDDETKLTWLYGHTTVNNLSDGQPGTWGWIPAACLEKK